MPSEPEREEVGGSGRGGGELGVEHGTQQPPAHDDRQRSGPHQHQRAGAAAAYAAAQQAAGSGVSEDAEVHVDTGTDSATTELAHDGSVPATERSVAGTQPGVADADAEQQVWEDLGELTAKAQKADEYLSLAQRTQADFENYRKRTAREAALAQERGIAKLAKELLPAIDNLDRALAAALTFVAGSAEPGTPAPEPSDEQSAAAPGPEVQLIDGLRLVHAEVLAALARVGIEPFSPVGEVFDPQYHEAVAQHPFEGQAPGTVVEVYQQGFRFGETVLRPARVLVAA
ncbi:MAG: nucleotide exchange factor GrpE [Solirubrobacteraceae bacterium]